MLQQLSSYYSWACSSAIFVWKWGIWVIVLRRKCFYVSSILTFWQFFCTSDSFYQWWGIAQPMDAPTEVTRWDGRTYRGISILNMLFFRKICVWRYVSPYYLLEFTTFAVDHDPNASLSCTFTRKPLNCRLNCNNCYCVNYNCIKWY